MHPLTLFLFAAFLPTVWLMDLKALDEYVNLPDPHYNYQFENTSWVFHNFIFNVDTINMTSQKWLDESEVDKPVWSHELTVIVPYKTSPARRVKLVDSCLLIIQNNDWRGSTDEVPRRWLTSVSGVTTSIIAELNPVLIQPLTFFNHPLERKNITGYDITAYSWWRFLNDPNAPPHWLVQFPMVKATVRAMDTITDYVKKTYDIDITRFILVGVSLAGWTSWLTAAVDQRVVGIIPIAMDFLNFTETFHHQFRAYCGWSYMLKPFHEMNITQELDNPRFSDLASHVDPLAYNERYTNVSKYIVVLSGDEFFQPDNSRYYFSQLEGVKYLHIMPNTDYENLYENKLIYTVHEFYIIMARMHRLPVSRWNITMTNTSAIIYFTTFNTNKVYSYHADTVGYTRRDFRMKIAAGNSSQNNPVKWIQTAVEEVDIGVFKKEMPKPAEGWRGFFIQALHSPSEFHHLIITSEMVIIPDTGCRGKLV